MAAISNPTMTGQRRIFQMRAKSRPRPKRSATHAPIWGPKVWSPTSPLEIMHSSVGYSHSETACASTPMGWYLSLRCRRDSRNIYQGMAEGHRDWYTNCPLNLWGMPVLPHPTAMSRHHPPPDLPCTTRPLHRSERLTRPPARRECLCQNHPRPIHPNGGWASMNGSGGPVAPQPKPSGSRSQS
jgi:hypothetical protein